MCSIGDVVSAAFETESNNYMYWPLVDLMYVCSYNINAIIPKSHSDANLWSHIGNNGLAKQFNLQ